MEPTAEHQQAAQEESKSRSEIAVYRRQQMAITNTTRQQLPEWPAWMDLATLARYCCVSTRTLREWASQIDNPLPARRVGGKLFVSKDTFDSWMNAQPAAGPDRDISAIVDEIVSSVTGRN